MTDGTALIPVLLATIAIISGVTIAGTTIGKQVAKYFMDANKDQREIIVKQAEEIKCLSEEQIKAQNKMNELLDKNHELMESHQAQLALFNEALAQVSLMVKNVNGKFAELLVESAKKSIPHRRKYEKGEKK